MRLILLALSLSILVFNAWAEIITDSVHSIEHGKEGEEHLIYLNNGRVIFFEPERFERIKIKEGQTIEVQISPQNRLEKITHLPQTDRIAIEKSEENFQLEEPTVLNSYNEAMNIFRGMNRNYYDKSECTDRAHVWSYEESKKHLLVSRKVFMFFTSTYIRRYNYGWWFHVSPYTLVQEGDQITEYVLDRRFNSSPRTMKSWSDGFIHSRKACPVSTYNYYRANNYGEEHCFHVKSHMYNRLPLHVENEENTGRVKDRFYSSEVNFSYRAFYR